MNHLAGIKLHRDPLANLTDDERAVLSSFRTAYHATAPEGCDAEAAPTYKLTAPLPNSGWRPLDDVTLWRFLCADRRKGKFNPKAALERLTGTLKWRKDARMDAILDEKPSLAINKPLPRSLLPLPCHDQVPLSNYQATTKTHLAMSKPCERPPGHEQTFTKQLLSPTWPY